MISKLRGMFSAPSRAETIEWLVLLGAGYQIAQGVRTIAQFVVEKHEGDRATEFADAYPPCPPDDGVPPCGDGLDESSEQLVQP